MVRSVESLRSAVLRAALVVCILPSVVNAKLPDDDITVDSSHCAELAAIQLVGPFEFPWSVAFLPDHTMLVSEKPGRLKILRPGASPAMIAGVPPVVHEGQGGLLDIAVDPGFSTNQIIYLSYLHGSADLSSIRMLKARLDQMSNMLVDQLLLFESTPSPSPEQLGGRMAVTDDGFLFLTLGARWQARRAQDLADDAGKIIRLRTDGTIPDDNPFVSVPGARPEIWSYGHRNPQGLAFDARGQLWSHEHGPNGGDELNLISHGKNYGWPVITHGLTYSGEKIGEGTEKVGMEQPVRYWSPSIAPSGLAIQILGDGIVVWIGALAGQALIAVELADDRVVNERRCFQNELGRIRDVRIGPDEAIYIIVDDAQAWLYRLDAPTQQATRGPGR